MPETRKDQLDRAIAATARRALSSEQATSPLSEDDDPELQEAALIDYWCEVATRDL